MKSPPPKISIIVAVRDKAQTLHRCIRSITDQAYPAKDVVIIDGGSQDGSVDIIREYESRISYWESKTDNGIFHAWNKALVHAQGEWMCFLGADDFFLNRSVLASLAPYLDDSVRKGVRLVYGEAQSIATNGRTTGVRGKPWGRIGWLFRHGMPISLPHPGLMHHHSLFNEHGPFDETFTVAGDYEFLLRELLQEGRRARFVSGVKTVGIQRGGIADSSGPRVHIETARARRMHGLGRFSPIWTLVYLRAWARRMLNRIPSGTARFQ